jgi:uncharacterized protein (DUF2336 family)
MLNWLFAGGQKKSEDVVKKAPSYEEAREISASGDVAARRDLAECDNLQPEFLYYFATDSAPEVRRSVARNQAAPLQADALLSKDDDDDVRKFLATKVGRLIPNLSSDENEKVANMVFEVLETLANDKLPSVRAIIAEEIQALDNVPRSIVKLLAHDAEEIVSAPILQFSPLLNDDDLIALIASGLKSSALSAMARRQGVGERVSEAIVDTGDEMGVATLLKNDTSSINERTLEAVANMAKEIPIWQSPLVGRAELPIGTIRRISKFVGSALLKQLLDRNNIDHSLRDELTEAIENRVIEDSLNIDNDEDAKIQKQVTLLFNAGKLNAGAISKAIEKNDTPFIVHSLATLGELSPSAVKKMFTLKSAKAVLAITWKSGFDMTVAVDLQKQAAKIPDDKMILPAVGGGFPLSDLDMEWQLDLL